MGLLNLKRSLLCRASLRLRLRLRGRRDNDWWRYLSPSFHDGHGRRLRHRRLYGGRGLRLDLRRSSRMSANIGIFSLLVGNRLLDRAAACVLLFLAQTSGLVATLRSR